MQRCLLQTVVASAYCASEHAASSMLQCSYHIPCVSKKGAQLARPHPNSINPTDTPCLSPAQSGCMQASSPPPPWWQCAHCGQPSCTYALGPHHRPDHSLTSSHADAAALPPPASPAPAAGAVGRGAERDCGAWALGASAGAPANSRCGSCGGGGSATTGGGRGAGAPAGSTIPPVDPKNLPAPAAWAPPRDPDAALAAANVAPTAVPASCGLASPNSWDPSPKPRDGPASAMPAPPRPLPLATVRSGGATSAACRCGSVPAGNQAPPFRLQTM